MNEAFIKTFRAELYKEAFSRAFLDELKSMEKTAFLPILAAGAILGGGAAALGSLGFGKSEGMPQTRWYTPGTTRRIFGHFGELASYLVGGGATRKALAPAAHFGQGAFRAGLAAERAAKPGILGIGAKMLPGIGLGMVSSSLKGQEKFPMVYRPPTITGMTQEQMFGRAPAGAF